MYKKIVWVLILALLFLGSASCAGAELAAEVNGEQITLDELEQEVQTLQATLAAGGYTVGDLDDPQYRELLQDEALDTLIQDRILLQEMTRREISLDFDQAQEYMDMVKGIYGDEMFGEIIESSGTTEEAFLKDYALNAAIGELYDQVTAEVTVDAGEVQEFYELNPESFHRGQASHILLLADWETVDEAERESVEARAQEIIDRLNQGEDFAQLARELSDDGSAEQGGRLDASFSMMDSPFVDPFTVAALQLNEGEFTQEPVVSEFGLHIIRLDEKITDYETLKNDVESVLLQERRDAFFRDYVEELRQDSEINIYIDQENEDE